MATRRVLAPAGGTDTCKAWDKFFTSEVEDPFAPEEHDFTKEQFRKWEIFRDDFIAEILAKDLAKMSTSDTGKDDVYKLFRQITHDPGEFEDWWSNMQLHMLGFNKLTDIGKIIAVLTRCTKGEAASWALVKRQEVISDKLDDWKVFTKQLKARFSDPTKEQRALNDIHNFVQGKLSVQTYLDKFEQLKSRAKISDSDALYLVKRGLTPAIMNKVYGNDDDIPTDYTTLSTKLRKIGTNLDIAWGYQRSTAGMTNNNAGSTNCYVRSRSVNSRLTGTVGSSREVRH